MADDSRRPGDWQRKDLRQDANDLMEEPNQKKWHQQTFWIIFLLLVFWPVGIVLVWRSDWHIVAKVLASAYVVVAVYVSYNMSLAVQAMGR
ncbi:holotricin-3 [Gordonibacter massiliensis (ex Traore et al. 2017)]|uniref:Holotricin-3 n=1 Tax=Gordonibacter massiliensis (ex Traore et al. 2017) TaxID=1841863 RepID=A0A842JGG9_9ACTN|nr:holotricin-3 [Gordonibacter massiliensis (ex Traore et al. 2017)]MBC2888905.1 holotricin-3 [Gordonibacter massiliensis (ex Traore et al. 2017)]